MVKYQNKIFGAKLDSFEAAKFSRWLTAMEFLWAHFNERAANHPAYSGPCRFFEALRQLPSAFTTLT